MVFDKRIKGINVLRFGTDYFYSNERTTYTLFNGNKYTDGLEDNLNALFAETDLYLTTDLALKAGGRLEHSTLMDK
ncbi:MAG: hypothetical protein WKF88_01295, partial [Ferruginibacter sp.]